MCLRVSCPLSQLGRRQLGSKQVDVREGIGHAAWRVACRSRYLLPPAELDAVANGRVRDRVTAAIAEDGWVVNGNYSVPRDLTWDRADTVVWLDLSRPAVMRQVVARSLRRMATRESLWNGNRER